MGNGSQDPAKAWGLPVHLSGAGLEPVCVPSCTASLAGLGSRARRLWCPRFAGPWSRQLSALSVTAQSWVLLLSLRQKSGKGTSLYGLTLEDWRRETSAG